MLKTTSREDLELWREALAHLRHLSDDVWRGLFLFVPLALVLLLADIALFGLVGPQEVTPIFPALLSLAGALLMLPARYLLKRHRVYYLQMLARKALLEDALGFYAERFPGTNTDLAFPWRLAPEAVADIKKDFDGWVKQSIRRSGTIANYQFLIYEVLLGLFVIALAGSLVALFG